MSQLLSLFGLGSGGLGASGGSSSSSTNTTQAQTQNTSQSGQGSTTTTYAPGQANLQDLLMKALSSMIPGMSSGSLTPNVQAMETGSADQINQSYQSLGDRANRFLAARGFGKSGQVGQTQLKTELAREGALGTNASNAAGLQLSQNQNFLSDALQAAFASMGSSYNQIGSGVANTNTTGTSDTSGSGWGVGMGVGASAAPKG